MNPYSIIVIGAGAGGLVIAIGASKAGKKVLIVERGHWGGDCTNFGCIPSKSLIASAQAAYALKDGSALGLENLPKAIKAAESLSRVRSIISEVRSHEDAEALQKIGVETLEGTGSFVDPHTLNVNGTLVSGKKIVIATGSSPMIPPIQGLKETPFLTNETIFDLKEIPRSLIVLGGGPIGCELSQAMQRLGCQVTLVHSHEVLLGKEELEAQKVIAEVFSKEGIQLHLGFQTEKVSYQKGMFTLQLQSGMTLHAEQLLVSTGRRPNISSLNLPAAGVVSSEKGIPIDRWGRTNQSHIFAIGDVNGGPLFTHYAEYQARTVLASLLLPFKKKLDQQPIPRVTYTDPEVASVGMMEKEVLQHFKPGAIAIYTIPLSSVDRAITAGRTEGFIKIITKKWSSRILGATIVAPRAGEMLMEISTAIFGKIPLRHLAKIIHPYPTYSLGIRKAADLWLTQTLLPLFSKKK